MTIKRRTKIRSGRASTLNPIESRSPIASCRVADLPEILSLYLDAVELALHGPNGREIVPADDGSQRRRAGSSPYWDFV